jgi:hypothetical protein
MIAEITTKGFTWIHFLVVPAVSGQNSCSSGYGADPGHNEAAFLLFGSTNFPEIHDQETLKDTEPYKTFCREIYTKQTKINFYSITKHPEEFKAVDLAEIILLFSIEKM